MSDKGCRAGTAPKTTMYYQLYINNIKIWHDNKENYDIIMT